MTPRHVKWTEMADELVNGGWGQAANDSADAVTRADDNRIQAVLLLDIAKSLRVLRCANFVRIPYTLEQSRKAVAGLRRDMKVRGRKAR